MRSARIRAIASDGPPAENGTMMVMGREGKFCASAAPPNASDADKRGQEQLFASYFLQRAISSSLRAQRSDVEQCSSPNSWIASLRSQ